MRRLLRRVAETYELVRVPLTPADTEASVEGLARWASVVNAG